MGRRLDLQAILESICPHVYFQPPSNVQIQHPAIVYELDRANTIHADDRPYRITNQYSVKLISQNPDDGIFEALAALPMCVHERYFAAENLNHNVFSLYF